MFFNTNSDYLRGCLIPPHYSARNPTSPITIADTRIARDQKVFPAHAATVNRGYREGFLKPDGRLDAFTAACAPHIYRATLLGEGFYGNAFVCEATSNLVRRAIISEKDGVLTAKNAYENREFIASTYERFRPVNLATGPEGALYVVDMHHGLIQHRISLTDWAKAEYKKKQLDKFNSTGRIFRIVPDGVTPSAHPQLTRATTLQLVQQLSHPNAWWRETSQRLLVEQNDPSAVALLKQLALHGSDSLDRVTALWTLDGMKCLDDETIHRSFQDADAKVRVNAIRLAESRAIYPDYEDRQFLADLRQLASDDSPEVRLQFVLSMSACREEWVAAVLGERGDERNLREAAVSGLSGLEISFLRQRATDSWWSQQTPGRVAALTDVARSVFRRGKPDEVTALVALIGQHSADHRWQQSAMLAALPPALEDEYGATKLIALPAKPPAIEQIAKSTDPDIRTKADRVAALFDWPGKPATTRPAPVALTPRQQELFEIGRTQYALICAQCHRPDGLGQEGKAPPLLNSRWVLGPDKRLARIVLHGMRGPIPVGDKIFNLDMPALKALSDDQIAAVLTYIRRSWGHTAPPVDPATVQTIREWQQARRDGWTVPELLEVK
jgi:mono/diheme cytochrome c family protein